MYRQPYCTPVSWLTSSRRLVVISSWLGIPADCNRAELSYYLVFGFLVCMKACLVYTTLYVLYEAKLRKIVFRQ